MSFDVVVKISTLSYSILETFDGICLKFCQSILFLEINI